MYIFKQKSSSKSNSCCVKEDKAKLCSTQFSINVRRRHNISRVNSRKAEDTVEGVRHGMPVKYVELGLFLGQGSVLLQQLFQEAKGRRLARIGAVSFERPTSRARIPGIGVEFTVKHCAKFPDLNSSGNEWLF